MNPSVFVPLTLLAIGAGVFLLLRWLSRVDADDPGRCYPAFAGATHSHLFGSMWIEAGDR